MVEVDVPDWSRPVLTGVRTVRLSRPRLKAVKVKAKNEPVLAALRKLSGEDFGYDRAAWLRWWGRAGFRMARDQEKDQRVSAAVAATVHRVHD